MISNRYFKKITPCYKCHEIPEVTTLSGVFTKPDRYIVRCYNCNISYRYAFTEEEAISVWNTRMRYEGK